ncbi:hypothetical protein BJ508DRAFT_418016 [Ascobolus immersus RN42]|uniref:Uncharacterized protein n=1 Tax=Ascobolus immersus RN42 TaxID=1160509 RepID=A0A3N4HV24_ASCIM|nr:hypothetical protein BJ508DRAFT_418016 [Ascobolus immersus RN42]
MPTLYAQGSNTFQHLTFPAPFPPTPQSPPLLTYTPYYTPTPVLTAHSIKILHVTWAESLVEVQLTPDDEPTLYLLGLPPRAPRILPPLPSGVPAEGLQFVETPDGTISSFLDPKSSRIYSLRIPASHPPSTPQHFGHLPPTARIVEDPPAPLEGPVCWKLEDDAPRIRAWAVDAMDRVYVSPTSDFRLKPGQGGLEQRQEDRVLVWPNLETFFANEGMLEQAPLPGPPGSYDKVLTSTTCGILPPKHNSLPLLTVAPPCEVHKPASLGRTDVMHLVGWVEFMEGAMLDMESVTTNAGTFTTACRDEVGESLYIWGGQYDFGQTLTDLPWVNDEEDCGVKHMAITDGTELWVVDNHSKIYRKPSAKEEWSLFEPDRWGDYNNRTIQQFVGGTWGLAMVIEESERTEVEEEELWDLGEGDRKLAEWEAEQARKTAKGKERAIEEEEDNVNWDGEGEGPADGGVGNGDQNTIPEEKWIGGEVDRLAELARLERENEREFEEVKKMMDP